MILCFSKIAQQFISWLRLLSPWNQRNDISYALNWTWTWRFILFNINCLTVAIDINLTNAFLVLGITVSSLANTISWCRHTAVLSSRGILVLAFEGQDVLLWLLELLQVLLHLLDFIFVIILVIQHATLVRVETAVGLGFISLVLSEVVRLVLRNDALALELELLARTHSRIEISWLLDVFIKWYADIIKHFVVFQQHFGGLTWCSTYIGVLWNRWHFHIIKIMLELLLILNQLHGLNLNLTQSNRVFRTRSLMWLKIIILIIFRHYHSVICLCDNLRLRNHDLWLEKSILVAAIICINSRRYRHYSSCTDDTVVLPSWLQCWFLSIWLLSSWFDAAASWCFWFFNFYFFIFCKWILDGLFFTLFGAFVWTFDAFVDGFVWAFNWTTFVTLSALFHFFLTLSQSWFFFDFLSSLDQIIKRTTWCSWLRSVLSYTFSNLSSLAWKSSNFNLSNFFSSLNEWFGSFVLNSTNFATEGLSLWILGSGRGCFQTRRCFFDNRQVILWFWHLSYGRFLWSWAVWILELSWIHLDVSIKFTWWNWHKSIIVRHVWLSTSWFLRVLKQVTVVAGGTLWWILSDRTLISYVVNRSSAWE